MSTDLKHATECSRTACKKPLKGKRYRIFNEPSTGIPRDYCIACGRKIVAANPDIQYAIGNGEEVTLALPVFLHRVGCDEFLGGHLGVGGERHDIYFRPGNVVSEGELICRWGDGRDQCVSYLPSWAERHDDPLATAAFKRALDQGLIRPVPAEVALPVRGPVIDKPSPAGVLLAAAVCVINRGRVLVGYHRRKKGWEFPGGKQEPGETIAETARRECGEEIKIWPAVEDLVLLGYVERPTNSDGENWLAMIFAYHCSDAARAEACGQEPQGIGQLSWLTPHAVLGMSDKTVGLQTVCDKLGSKLLLEVAENTPTEGK